jgi:cyclic pyranopterin phosphate synthase
MVDVSDKPTTLREATAKGMVRMQSSTFKLLKQGEMVKGDALAVAQIAGIMAAKKTPSLIPLCHPLLLSDVHVECRLDEENSSVEVTATVRTTGQTGVEMEALTAVTIAALTIYDMCKAVEPTMQLEAIRLVKKKGGKSGSVVLE